MSKTVMCRRRIKQIQASQWFKNGDHPLDNCRPIKDPDNGEVFLSEGEIVRRFRDPDIKGDSLCEECGHPYNDHGWIDIPDFGLKVCPGDWIVPHDDHFAPIRPSHFEANYEIIYQLIPKTPTETYHSQGETEENYIDG